MNFSQTSMTDFIELVRTQASKNPHNIAVYHRNQILNYEQLERRSNQLAHYLLSLKIQPEQLIGLCLPRSILLTEAMLGILKAGAAMLSSCSKSASGTSVPS
ncbi:MAG: AMP-binding protein [SAR324 cluster bacterium]|nr:AMP-binding protein [SAR324 cluster bacterium]